MIGIMIEDMIGADNVSLDLTSFKKFSCFRNYECVHSFFPNFCCNDHKSCYMVSVNAIIGTKAVKQQKLQTHVTIPNVKTN